ncbi:MAG: hypothetical protein ACYS83_11580 [Planctomycetota bacterium]|jgi:hypothetical protein
MDIKDARPARRGRLWQIAGSDPMAYNEPGKEPKVVIKEKRLHGALDKLSMPPFSISLYKLSPR